MRGFPGESTTEEPLELGFGFGGKAKGLVSWKWEPRPLLDSRTRRVAAAQRERGLGASGWGLEKSKSEPGDRLRRGWRERQRLPRVPGESIDLPGSCDHQTQRLQRSLGGAQALVRLQYSERSEGPEH